MTVIKNIELQCVYAIGDDEGSIAIFKGPGIEIIVKGTSDYFAQVTKNAYYYLTLQPRGTHG